MGAIEAAQNLLVSFAEKAVDDGLLDDVLVPRVSEVPSRSLRSIVVDAGKNDVHEKVVLTPTCELMQIVVLSRSMDEIAERVAKMIAGTKDGKAVTFGEFIDLWRITDILGDAVKPAKNVEFLEAFHVERIAPLQRRVIAPRGRARHHDGRARPLRAVLAARDVEKAGFAQSLEAARELCASAGIAFDDLALVAVKSPATMTDDDAAPADTSVPKSAWEKLTPQIMDALQDTLSVPADRTYIRYTGTADWGWNGGNF